LSAPCCEINDDWAVVRRHMTIENREEAQADPKALAPKKHAASSVKPDDATYTTLTDVTHGAEPRAPVIRP
jgi:hypothetical protein